MDIRNNTLFRAGQGLVIIAVLLIASDAGFGIFDGFGLWGTAIPLVLIAFGAYMINRATNGTWWNRN